MDSKTVSQAPKWLTNEERWSHGTRQQEGESVAALSDDYVLLSGIAIKNIILS